MKYKKIYDVISASGCTKMIDRSYWHKPVMNIVEASRPLWIILESHNVNLRLWVTHEYGQLRIATAQLDLNCNSKGYEDSIRRYGCKNQADMAVKLSKLLNSATQTSNVDNATA